MDNLGTLPLVEDKLEVISEQIKTEHQLLVAINEELVKKKKKKRTAIKDKIIAVRVPAAPAPSPVCGCSCRPRRMLLTKRLQSKAWW